MDTLTPINVGLEHTASVGKIVEIQTTRITQRGGANEREYRRHYVGRLVGFTDEFENDELYETTFFLEGATTNTHRTIEIKWTLSGVDPEQQLIQEVTS